MYVMVLRMMHKVKFNSFSMGFLLVTVKLFWKYILYAGRNKVNEESFWASYHLGLFIKSCHSHKKLHSLSMCPTKKGGFEQNTLSFKAILASQVLMLLLQQMAQAWQPGAEGAVGFQFNPRSAWVSARRLDEGRYHWCQKHTMSMTPTL